MAWKSIKSAPKTGDIQVYCESSKEQFVAFWNPQYKVFQVAKTSSGVVVGVKPSHWRPIFKPPNAQGVRLAESESGPATS